MRSSIILPIALVAASVAPAIAMPTAPTGTGSEAVNWHEVGTVAKDVAGAALDVAPFFFRRELEDALLARAAASKVVDWTTLPKQYGLEREAPVAFRRELEDALIARAQPAGSEAINWGTVAKDGLKIAGTVAPLFFRRELEDALMARAQPTGSEAIKWGTVAKDGLKIAGTVAPLFFKRELEDALMAREAESEAIKWGTVAKDGLKIAGTVAPLFFRRELEDAVLARALGLTELGPERFHLGPGLVQNPPLRSYRRSIFDELE